ncbi:hypothetical protein [Amycolatopsis sp. CA-230715]|uniref:hypothetical protein n=1 Tax=Amycolatopsis sp. CA-230715 TaxID=2745196 RepID=UPI001C01BAEF|nr:hypothetical protein [Amycolatopsis sp. CA-230715]QWF83615.1 hypothetical protein HUW46_07058 [Amycolatopsis sp. CA-230715]
MKSVVWWSVGLLIGLALMALGAFGTVGNGGVLCGSEAMRPGTYCETTSYGTKSRKSYEEKRQEAIDDANAFQSGGRWITLGIGAVVAAGCGWRLVVAIRRRGRNRGSDAVTQQLPPGGHPGFAQPPGFPPPQGFAPFPQPGYRPPQGPPQR